MGSSLKLLAYDNAVLEFVAELERQRYGGAAAGTAGVAAAGGGAPPQLDIERSRRVRRALTAAFFMHAALRQPTGEYLALVSREHVAVHPSSVLFSRKVRGWPPR